MWQSRVEIVYSVMCFDYIAAVYVTYHQTYIKGGVHTCFEDSHASTKCVWAAPSIEEFGSTVQHVIKCDEMISTALSQMD